MIKKSGKKVKAYRLGDRHPVLEELMSRGQIKKTADGRYEVFSLEAVRAGSGRGEIAQAGDYVKIDGEGFPYPNDCDFFRKNHRRISGDEYEQLPVMLDAWDAEEPMSEEIRFLMERKGLEIHEETPENYFRAPLWGTEESAAKDAVVVFYHIDRDENGEIADAGYNFVCRSEFDRTYLRC